MAEATIYLRNTGGTTYTYLLVSPETDPTSPTGNGDAVVVEPVSISSIRILAYLGNFDYDGYSGSSKIMCRVRLGSYTTDVQEFIAVSTITYGSYQWYEKTIELSEPYLPWEIDFDDPVYLRLAKDISEGPSIRWRKQSTSFSYLWELYGEVYVPDPPGKAQNPTPENDDSGVSKLLNVLQWEAPD